MDLRGELAALKNRVMAAIEQAAKGGETRRIMDLSGLLAEIERDEQTATGLEERLRSHRARLDAPHEVLTVAQPAQPVEATSARQRRKDPRPARRMREEYQSLWSLRRESRGGAICRTPSGSRVGIGAASEITANRWWSGIQDTQLDCVVLLCPTDKGVLDFVLPMASFADVWPHLSRNEGGQVIFNVSRRGGSYELQVPGLGPLDIGRFLGQHAPLA